MNFSYTPQRSQLTHIHTQSRVCGVDAVVLRELFRDRAGDAGAGAGLGGRRGQRGAAGSMPAKICSAAGARCRGMAGTGLGARRV